jgi:hypothetical protein
MNDKYKVELLTPQQTEAFLRGRKPWENPFTKKPSAQVDGMEIVGEYFLTAKDARSGEVEWEHSGKNLITDSGRRAWMEARFASLSIVFAPSVETPISGRSSLVTDFSQAFESSTITPTNASATNTKTFSTTFSAPATTRTLGTIGLGRTTSLARAGRGLYQIMAYALLSPSKTQTTTQTLEVVYKVSMNPIA